jgi:hypothetical protein
MSYQGETDRIAAGRGTPFSRSLTARLTGKLGKEPAIRPLHVNDLRRKLVFGRTPVIHDEGVRSHHLGDVLKRLSVSVHRGDDCTAGVAVQQNAIRIAALGNAPQRRHATASTSAYVTASGSLAAK